LIVLAAKAPDAPTNLANIVSLTSGYQVGLSWSPGAYNGGSVVIDYQVSFAEESSSVYTIFASGISSTSTVVNLLSPGVSYKFIVRSRNVVNFSAYSASVTVLAA